MVRGRATGRAHVVVIACVVRGRSRRSIIRGLRTPFGKCAAFIALLQGGDSVWHTIWWAEVLVVAVQAGARASPAFRPTSRAGFIRSRALPWEVIKKRVNVARRWTCLTNFTRRSQFSRAKNVGVCVNRRPSYCLGDPIPPKVVAKGSPPRARPAFWKMFRTLW